MAATSTMHELGTKAPEFSLPDSVSGEVVSLTDFSRHTGLPTPDFFLFGPERKLVYRGRFDESRPANGLPVTGKDLRAAVDAVLAGEEIDPDQYPSMGCSIKWKPGNAPAYFSS